MDRWVKKEVNTVCGTVDDTLLNVVLYTFATQRFYSKIKWVNVKKTRSINNYSVLLFDLVSDIYKKRGTCCINKSHVRPKK